MDTEPQPEQSNDPLEEGALIRVPSTGGWPLVAAFGLSMLWAGMLTHWMLSAFGAICLVAGLAGWFREVLPKESHIEVLADAEPVAPVTDQKEVRHLAVGEGGHRARLPLQIHPYSAGIRGGMAGGVAMIVLALIYGLGWHQSIWYPINLLAAAASPQISAMDYAQLCSFSMTGLVLAAVIHTSASLFVGLLYGIALPMTPRHPILFGGFLAPIFWSGLLHSAMGIINPALQGRVDWFWFIIAQIGFGVVAGIVVAREEHISTLQFVPFVHRMGIEAAEDEEEKS